MCTWSESLLQHTGAESILAPEAVLPTHVTHATLEEGKQRPLHIPCHAYMPVCESALDSIRMDTANTGVFTQVQVAKVASQHKLLSFSPDTQPLLLSLHLNRQSSPPQPLHLLLFLQNRTKQAHQQQLLTPPLTPSSKSSLVELPTHLLPRNSWACSYQLNLLKKRADLTQPWLHLRNSKHQILLCLALVM